MSRPGWIIVAFISGVLLGLVAYPFVLGSRVDTSVPRDLFDEQQVRIEELEQENAELTDELFSPSYGGPTFLSSDEMPYDESADAAIVIEEARAAAKADGKLLMVTFGANWCVDCRTLHHHLSGRQVSEYATELFDFAFIDVGKLNRNRDVAASLGVSLARGIPVAIFFDQEGEILGTTNDGQLETARLYSSQQILKFVRDVAERAQIQSPDSIN